MYILQVKFYLVEMDKIHANEINGGKSYIVQY